VPTANQVVFSGVAVGTSALLALLFLILAAFPGQLFNKTYEENEAEIGRWFARGGALTAGFRTALARFWGRPIGIVIFVIISALLYGFLSPSFGLSQESVASFIGILIGLLVVMLAFELPLVFTQRRVNRDRGHVRVLPVTLIVALFCVVISRVTGFQPGYLYGLILGYVFAHELSLRDEARAHVSTAIWILVVSLGAWLLLPFAGQSLTGEPLVTLALSTALATIFVAGLEALMFELVPLRFLRGEVVYTWRRSVWAVLFTVAAFLFVFIMLEPQAGYLGSTRVSPLLPAVILFVVFGLASVLFWAYFRFRPERTEPDETMA